MRPNGSRFTVGCPATSANLGPGFDAIGLAVGIRNEVAVTLGGSGVRVEVVGEGAGRLATGGGNLVARAAARGFARLGVPQPGLDLRCVNRIPTGRGLGSSAAAIVAGVALAYAAAHDGEPLDREWVLGLAAEIEGHPDNVAACVYGGATVAWTDDAGSSRCAALDPDPTLDLLLLVPPAGASTAVARSVLPPTVPHADAARTAGRAALLTTALTHRPDLLLDATQDWLHQPYRWTSTSATGNLVRTLRERGSAAAVSGAGPAVVVLGTGGVVPDERLDLPDGWTTVRPGIDRSGVQVAT